MSNDNGVSFDIPKQIQNTEDGFKKALNTLVEQNNVIIKQNEIIIKLISKIYESYM